MLQAKLPVGVLIALVTSSVAWAADGPAPAGPNSADVTSAVTPEKTVQSPSSQYLVAYDSMVQADWLKKQGMTGEAIELFTEAKNLFQKLAADYPLWETNVVAFRITYCVDELAKLRPATPAPAATAAPLTPAATHPLTVTPQPQVDESRVSASLGIALKQERSRAMKRALETYLTLLEEQPQNREALKGAGRCYLRLGMPQNASILLQRGMSLPNPDAQLNLLMALVHCYDREFYKAYQLLLIVINDQPVNATAHLAMGVALTGLNRIKDAQVETQKAIQLDPKLGEAYYNLARIIFKLNPSNPASARGHYFNALRYGATPDPALEKQLR